MAGQGRDRNKCGLGSVTKGVRATILTAILALAACISAAEQRLQPVRVASLHYPCMALLAKIEGTVRVACPIAADGACMKPKIISGHPLLIPDVIENAKRWLFPPDRSSSGSRTVNISYVFRIRGVRIPGDNSDVEVVFDCPNTVTVTAPFDAKIACHWPPGE